MTLVLPVLILKFTKKEPNSCHKLVSGSVENTDHLDTETLSSGKLVSKLESGYGENTDHFDTEILWGEISVYIWCQGQWKTLTTLIRVISVSGVQV